MRHVFCRAGIIYERVQPAKRFGSRSDAPAIVIGSDIALDDNRFGSRHTAGFGDFFSTVPIRQVVYDEARAGIRETDGGGRPEARRRSRDNRTKRIFGHRAALPKLRVSARLGAGHGQAQIGGGRLVLSAAPHDLAFMQALDVVAPSDAPPLRAMSPEDEAALREAVHALERTTFAGRLTAMVGRQIDFAGKLVPQPISGAVGKAVTLALRAAMRVALAGLASAPPERGDRRNLHRALVTASGAVGGAFGLVTLPVELPVSTTLILRSIAEIARAEGEDLSDPEAALACLEVFALGGQPGASDLVEGGYFALRGFLAKSVSEAARHIALRGVGGETAPILLRLMSQIAGRFG